MSRSRSVFIDEGVLDLNYVPPRLLHRDEELRFLNGLFRFVIEAPYEMSQRAVIVGGVGSGKTALAQRFGLNLKEEAGRRMGISRGTVQRLLKSARHKVANSLVNNQALVIRKGEEDAHLRTDRA